MIEQRIDRHIKLNEKCKITSEDLVLVQYRENQIY